jgi:hypothetical protein
LDGRGTSRLAALVGEEMPERRSLDMPECSDPDAGGIGPVILGGVSIGVSHELSHAPGIVKISDIMDNDLCLGVQIDAVVQIQKIGAQNRK